MRRRPFVLISLFLVYACDMFVVSSAFVVLPPMILAIFGNLSLAQRNLILGLLIATYPALQLFSVPIWGELSDRFGRRPILLFTTIGAGIGTCLTALGVYTGSIWLLFVSRALGGLMDGNMTVSMAGVADLSPVATRGRYLAVLTGLGGLSWAIGAVASTALSDFGFPMPFLVLGLFLIAQAPVVAFALKPISGPKPPLHLSRAYARIFSLLSDREAIRPLLLLIAQLIGFYLYIGFLGAYLIEWFGFPRGEEGLAYTVSALAWFTGGLIANQWLLKRYKASSVAILPLIAVPLIILAFSFFDHPISVWLVIPFAGMGEAMVQAALLTLTSLGAGPDRQGKVFGTFGAGLAFSAIVGPALSGWLARFSLQLPFYISAAVMAAAAVTYYFWKPKTRFW